MHCGGEYKDRPILAEFKVRYLPDSIVQMLKTKYPNDLYEQSLLTGEFLTLAVRNGSYGIFDNIDDFRQIMIIAQEL